jgi:tetratricopeptide (TPR) repeat protein
MRTMAPRPGTYAPPRPGTGVAALERLEWLRTPAPPVSRGAPWAVVAVLAVLVTACVAGLVTASDPFPAEAKLAAAYRAQQGGDLAGAAELYTEVVEADPANATAQFNLGLIHHTQADLFGAAERYEAALDANPTFVPALFNLAVVRAETDPSAAIDLYRRLLAVEPDHAAANLNLGVLLLEQGDAAEASGLIDRALALDPSLRLD